MVVFLVDYILVVFIPFSTLADRHFCASFWFGHGFGVLDMGTHFIGVAREKE